MADEGATKSDLHALESRMFERMERSELRMLERMEQSESRMLRTHHDYTEHSELRMLECLEKSETNLLKEFASGRCASSRA